MKTREQFNRQTANEIFRTGWGGISDARALIVMAYPNREKRARGFGTLIQIHRVGSYRQESMRKIGFSLRLLGVVENGVYYDKSSNDRR
jgi:hypothetical protein